VHLKSDLIRGVVFDEEPYKRGVVFDEEPYKRGVVFDERNLIKEEWFLMRGALYKRGRSYNPTVR
jgi:hypothetical protein